MELINLHKTNQNLLYRDGTYW